MDFRTNEQILLDSGKSEELINTMKRKYIITSDNPDNIELSEIYWDDLLDNMKRDFGEFTDIKSLDFRFITEWLKNKIVNKNITE